MFAYVRKLFRILEMKQGAQAADENTAAQPLDWLSKDLSENLRLLRGVIGANDDIKIRLFEIGMQKNVKAALVFVDGLVNIESMNENVLGALMYGKFLSVTPDEEYNFKAVREKMLYIGEVQDADRMTDVIDGYLSGDAVLMMDGCAKALIIGCKGWEQRAVEKPQNESVVRGPLESFNEDFRITTALLRRKIQHPDLIIETMRIGRKTRTRVGIAYIKGIADDSLVEEVKKRLNSIHTDAILESGYIEQYIEDAPYSLFPTVGHTEKPDVLAAKILEGRVGIIVDGTPFVLTVPLLFIELFQTAEDYYNRPYSGSMLRFIRYGAVALSILMPAVYVALITFHQELIPTPLLLTTAASREGTPFPAVVEAGLMVVLFEVLKEAGVRLPNPVGQAISIVGALIIGESAVSAGLIGAPMVIIIALTAVSGFIVYKLNEAVTILRIIILILASMLGGFGITMGLLGILIHLSSLKSFGFPYLSPVAPFDQSGMKDAIIRAPFWKMKTRPRGMADKNEVRRGPKAEPGASSNQ